ncbi:phosphotransferase [Bacillus sp. NP157]|nr:phosphotransferase [Bacillus sp. NP157]
MTHTAHLTHGLAGDELPPDWPPLAEAEVASLLERIPAAGMLKAIAWRSPRPLSAAALVDVEGGRFFIKRHHASVRTAKTLAEEHRFATHLRTQGLPVPALHADINGATAIAMGDWTFEVHTPARGRDIYRDAYSWSPVGSVAQARTAGAMLARVHLASRGYEAPQRSTHILVARADLLEANDPVCALEAQLGERPALARFLATRDWRDELRATMAPWHAAACDAVAAQPRLWTHGDWHVSNLCWSGEGDDATITDVLDMGLSASTFALFDVATAIERNAIAWLEIERGDIGRDDLAVAMLAGYHSVSPFTSADLAALAAVLPLVHVDFALSEVEYFEGVTGRRDHAGVAWHTFLHGHAAWFASAPGQRLLDAIRDAGRDFVLQ